MSEFPKPSITADTILFDYEGQQVCLIQRKHAPFQDHWALIGGFFNPERVGEVEPDSSIEAAAWRELREEASVDAFGPQVMARGFSHVVDTVGRDPRGRVVTFVYYVEVKGEIEVVAQDDAKEIAWFSVDDLINKRVKLAFDHEQILMRFFDAPF